MPCVDEKGNLSDNALKLMKSLSEKSKNSTDLSSELGIPIFKVRSSLRELSEAIFLSITGDLYEVTAKGKTSIKAG